MKGDIELHKILSGIVIIICLIVYVFYTQYKGKKVKKLEEEMILEEGEFSEEEERENISREREYVFENRGVKKNEVCFCEETEVKEDVLKEEFNTETDVEYGSTTLLAFKPEIRKLVNLKGMYPDIEVNDVDFIIGKKADCVDGVINDEMISRIHARLNSQGGKYYLTDLNSTNGTFCNDIRLEANQQIEIKDEDVLRFGRVEYIFR